LDFIEGRLTYGFLAINFDYSPLPAGTKRKSRLAGAVRVK